MGVTVTTLAQEFTSKWRPIITPIAQKYGINPDFALAQIAQEAWWGTRIPTGSHNYAGIQDFRKKSDGVMANDAGRQRKFRKFANEEAFAEHYLNMLSRLYPDTKSAKTIDEFTSALQDGKRKYAESLKYKQYVGEVYNDHFASGSARTATPHDIPAVGTTHANASMVNVDPARDGGFEMSPPKSQTQTNDPYESLWGVKQPKPTEPVKNPRLTTGRQTPYKPGSYKFNWGK